MTKGSRLTAGLAGLGLVAVTVAYVARGVVPDPLVVFTSTALGGFLGISYPSNGGK